MPIRRKAEPTTPTPRTAALRMPRTRGLASGVLLMLLGAWAALVPFIGPSFGYTIADVDAWTWDADALWLSIAPGAAALIGGLLLATSANRAGAGLGGWLALAGGVWLAIAPAMRLVFDDTFGYGTAEGASGLEHIGFFFGTGAAITALAAFALGRMTLRGHRDPGVVEERRVGDVERRRHERGAAEESTGARTSG